MLAGIRNLIIINSLLGAYHLYQAITHYQAKGAWNITLVIAIGFILAALPLFLRMKLVWSSVRIVIYALALVTGLACFLDLVNSYFLVAALNLLYTFYLLGARGYLGTTPVREYFRVEEHSV